MLKYFMVVWVLPMPNLQHRDPTVMARPGVKGRQEMVTAVPAKKCYSLREAPYPGEYLILMRADLPFLSPSSKVHLHLCQSPKLCPALPIPVPSSPC